MPLGTAVPFKKKAEFFQTLPMAAPKENDYPSTLDELVKSLPKDDFVKSSPAKAGQGAQKLRSEANLSRVSRDNDEVAAQSRFQRD
jgi:hypothetical protein